MFEPRVQAMLEEIPIRPGVSLRVRRLACRSERDLLGEIISQVRPIDPIRAGVENLADRLAQAFERVRGELLVEHQPAKRPSDERGADRPLDPVS